MISMGKPIPLTPRHGCAVVLLAAAATLTGLVDLTLRMLS